MKLLLFKACTRIERNQKTGINTRQILKSKKMYVLGATNFYVNYPTLFCIIYKSHQISSKLLFIMYIFFFRWCPVRRYYLDPVMIWTTSLNRMKINHYSQQGKHTEKNNHEKHLQSIYLS